MGVSNEILIKSNKKGFKIKLEIPIIVSYEGDTSTQNPVSHGASVIMSTLRFISIEHPLKFYGIPGLIFLMIGLIFTILTIQGFTETRQILLSTKHYWCWNNNFWDCFVYDIYYTVFSC